MSFCSMFLPDMRYGCDGTRHKWTKPDWCPIKKMPERKMYSKSICIAIEEY